MGNRPTEARDTKPQEDTQDFAGRASRCWLGC
jgi:hypothetical protein